MKHARTILSIIFLIAGALSLTVLATASAGGSSAVGIFLLSSYSYMAYGIPLFYFWFFALFAIGGHNIKRIIWPMCAIIPYVFLTVALRINQWDGLSDISPLLQKITNTFGQDSAVLLFVFLGVLLIIAEVFLYVMQSQKNTTENLEEAIHLIEEEQEDMMKEVSQRENQAYAHQHTSTMAEHPANRRVQNYQQPPLAEHMHTQQYPQAAPSSAPQVGVSQPIAQSMHRNPMQGPAQRVVTRAKTTPKYKEEFILTFNKKKTDRKLSRSGVGIIRRFEKEVAHDEELDNSMVGVEGYIYPESMMHTQSMQDSVQDEQFYHEHTPVYTDYPETQYQDSYYDNSRQMHAEDYHPQMEYGEYPHAIQAHAYPTQDESYAYDMHDVAIEDWNADGSPTYEYEEEVYERNDNPHQINSQFIEESLDADIEKSEHYIDNPDTQKSIEEKDQVEIGNERSEDHVGEDSTVDTTEESKQSGNPNVQNPLAFREKHIEESIEPLSDSELTRLSNQEAPVFDLSSMYKNDDINEIEISTVAQSATNQDNALYDSNFQEYTQNTGVPSEVGDEYIDDVANIATNALNSPQYNQENKLGWEQGSAKKSVSVIDENIGFMPRPENEIYNFDDIPLDKDIDDIESDNIETETLNQVAVKEIDHGAMKLDLAYEPIEELVPEQAKIEVSKPKTKKRRRGSYKIPIMGLIDPPAEKEIVDEGVSQKIAHLLEITLLEFKIEAKVTAICRGPVVTMFEILPAPGVRLRRIVELSDNLALRLAAPSIRIVAPIPGKEAVGIEVPNKYREVVAFSELVSEKKFLDKEKALPVALGKNISNDIQIIDIARTPHLLIAGATGSGKSVCVNSIITSLLYRCSPDEVKLILIDPKIVELSFYNGIGHLLTPVISDPDKSIQALKWCVGEMERRYRKLETLNVREIRNYNKKLKEMGVPSKEGMPFIVVIIDEFADLMMTCGKEIEGLVSRLTAKSRAVGIHLVVATQRPSTDVITGLIKSNIPTRISFMVTSKTDSRIILDMNGAENLLGKGDMLYSSASDPFPERIQGPYLSEDEVQKVVEYVKEITGEPEYISEEIFTVEDEEDRQRVDEESEDPLWESAIEEVMRVKKASASHLQRRFKIGYNRAARLVEDMEGRGLIGPQQGSKPREVYTSID